MFEREDWKLFRNLDTLCQKAGVAKDSIPKLVVKELVDNGLDTGTNCEVGILPNNGFYVQDDGDGIDPNMLKDFFSINRPMITSKLLRLPTKGALGNGLRVVVGTVVSSGGKLVIFTRGGKYEVIPQEDGTSVVTHLDNYSKNGSRIEVYFGHNLPVRESDLVWGRLAKTFSSGNGNSYNTKTSPFWYNSESFYELANAYTGDIISLCMFFEGINKVKANEISALLTPSKKANELTFKETETLLGSIRSYSKEINYKKLGYCGDMYRAYGEYVRKNGTIKQYTVKGKFDAVIPYTVEGWVEFQEKESVIFLVNKTPITGEIRTWMNGKDLCISGCGLIHGFKSKPARLVMNIQTPYMPITSDGKAPNLKEFYNEIKQVLLKANRKAKKAYAKATNGNAQNEKEVIYINMKNAIQHTSSYNKYKFSQRQLYYSIRPYIIDAFGKELEYNYFCRVLTEYENEYGMIRDLYRDPRGMLYHPHTGEMIPLGTQAVCDYNRPRWTFNKIVYLEKKGTIQTLREAGFPEKYDCALMSSEGFASRAVKDLLDLLGDTEEEIQIFCVHDGDASGTMIYQTLQEGTLTREARRIKVVNLGLEPWEATKMNLQTEKVNSKSTSKKPTAKYVKDYDFENRSNWRYWLQDNRVELNAMTPELFIEWMEGKMEEHGVGKVIPDEYTLVKKLSDDINSLYKEKIMNEILMNAGYTELVDSAVKSKSSEIAGLIGQLREKVGNSLQDNQENHWTQPINFIAKRIVEE